MACVCVCSCPFCFALCLCTQDAECLTNGSICSSSLVIIRVRVIINNHPEPTRSMCKKTFRPNERPRRGGRVQMVGQTHMFVSSKGAAFDMDPSFFQNLKL